MTPISEGQEKRESGLKVGDPVAVMKKAALPQLEVLGYGRIDRITGDNPRHYYVEGFFMPKEARVLRRVCETCGTLRPASPQEGAQ